MNGGYAMVDCKKLNLLAQSAQTISGIFAACRNAIDSGKPIIACNCEYGEGVPLTPIPVFAIEQGGEFCLSASILQVWVSSEDSVRIVPLINSAKTTKTATK